MLEDVVTDATTSKAGLSATDYGNKPPGTGSPVDAACRATGKSGFRTSNPEALLASKLQRPSMTASHLKKAWLGRRSEAPHHPSDL